jgi:SAM-dependent methyltransferase
MTDNCKGYCPSHYYPDKPLGSFTEDQLGHSAQIYSLRNENLEAQTFEDELFDLVITQDVFEHIFNPALAFKEVARTLRPGGAHIFTVPLVNKEKPSEKWATLDDNGLRFLHTEEYHGNPIDNEGSPVSYHWGYDIVDFIKESSGLDTSIITIDALQYGIRAEYIEVLVSAKPKQQ